MTKHTLIDCFSLHARIGWQGLRSEEFKTEGSYLVTGVDFHNGRVDCCYHVTEERYAQDKGIQLREHDLLITKDGTIEKTAVVIDCPEKATLNSGVFVVRAINNEVVPEFLHYVLHSHWFDLFMRNVLTGSTIKHLNQEKFYKFSFEAPDVPTQKKIVEVLEAAVMAGRPSELMYVETPLLEQLEKLGWTVVQLDDSEKHDPKKSFRESFSEVVILSRLKSALKRLKPWLNDMQIDELCVQVLNYPFPMNHMLENNEETYDRITEGLSADNEETGEVNCPVRLIDWTDVDAYGGPDATDNEFLAISQYKVRIPGKEEHIIPDIVLFVNGLPLVVIECKAPDITEPMAEGIDQLMRYQNRRGAEELEGVPELFYFNQIVMSTCFHDCRYSSITGGVSHFMEWKDAYPYKLRDINPNGTPSAQEIAVAGMLEPSHFPDIVQNFIAYKDGDNGIRVKLVPRYMQYRGASKKSTAY